MPGPCRRHGHRAMPSARSKRQGDRAARRRMAHGIADQIDEDLDDAARLAVGREPVRSARDTIVTLLLVGRRLEQGQRLRRPAPRGRCGRWPCRGSSLIERMTDSKWRAAAAMSSHRRHSRCAAARRCARRSLGAFDDPVERRAQRLVERLVELGRDSAAAPTADAAVAQRIALETGEAAVRRSDRRSPDRTSTLVAVRAARARWPAKAAARPARASSGISPASSSSSRKMRVSGWPSASSTVDAELLGQIGATTRRGASPRPPPIRSGAPPDRPRLVRGATCRGAAPRGGRRSSLRATSDNLVAFGHGADPQFDVMVGAPRRPPGARPEMPSLRASRATAAICGKASSAPMRPGLALQRGQLRVGRDQPAGASTRPRTGRGQTARWPRSPPKSSSAAR